VLEDGEEELGRKGWRTCQWCEAGGGRGNKSRHRSMLSCGGCDGLWLRFVENVNSGARCMDSVV